MVKKLSNFIFVLTHPAYWLQNSRTCMLWDVELNKQLDTPVFTEFGNHTVKLNGCTLWVSNYPYAFGSIYNSAEFLPTVETRRRLKKLYMEAMLTEKFDAKPKQ